MAMVTRKKLNRYLDYDPDTGIFRWKKSVLRHNPYLTTAGSIEPSGYVRITIEGRRYLGHRLAWFMMTGKWPKYIDHKNTDKADNRWCNLRKASRSQNGANAKRRRDNSSGYKGVSLLNNKWFAQIRVDGQIYFLGYFPTKEEAARTYNNAAKLHYGKFARLNEIQQ